MASKDKQQSPDSPVEPVAREQTSSADVGGETEEMVLTYNRETGEVTHINKLDKSGGRQEFSEEEYAQFFGQGGEECSEYDPETEAVLIAHQQAGFESGYYHGLMEYEAMLMGQGSGYTPEEEAAYHQGVADYHAMVSGEV